jgi:hypothetical protein
MIRFGELTRILNKEEIAQWHNILEKIRVYEESERQRKRK